MAGKEKKSDITVTSTAKTVENKAAEEKLQTLKDSAAKTKANADAAAQRKADERAEKQAAAEKAAAEAEAARKKAEKEAEKARKKAEKELEEKKQTVEKAALAAGSAVLSSALKEDDPKKRRRNLVMVAAAAVVLVVVFLLFREPILGLLGLNAVIPEGPLVQSDESGLAAFLPDEEMGYSRIDFTNAILGEAREEKELIVLEQDVKVDTEISNALANISLFKKTKTIHSRGTGQYTVDLSKINDEAITVDMDARTVTVTVPHTALHAIVVDAAQTTFEETEHAIFGFGDIKLTQEQQQLVEESIQDAMRAELDTQELYDQADEIGCLQIAEIFQPLVSAVAEEFIVQVVMA